MSRASNSEVSQQICVGGIMMPKPSIFPAQLTVFFCTTGANRKYEAYDRAERRRCFRRFTTDAIIYQVLPEVPISPVIPGKADLAR
jgi:hypothetical protein